MAITKEKFKVFGNVFDQFTEKTLFKLISQGHFDGLESQVYVGKESNVFTALKGQKRVIVKIYRLESCNFNKMFDYIKLDKRYLNLAKKKRKIVFSWVQREFRNLLKARDAGVNVPVPITFFNHVIVMSVIGDEELAPMLKDMLGGVKTKKELIGIKNKIFLQMKKLFKGNLVHGDLSGFNILFYKKPVLIDFSQATLVKSINAEELLRRDVKNILALFKKHRIDTQKDEFDQIIRKITLKTC